MIFNSSYRERYEVKILCSIDLHRNGVTSCLSTQCMINNAIRKQQTYGYDSGESQSDGLQITLAFHTEAELVPIEGAVLP